MVNKLKSVKYKRNHSITESKGKLAIKCFSRLKEKITKGNPIANSNINSTLPAFPINEEVMATLRLNAMIYIKRDRVRLPFFEIIAAHRKKGTVAPIYLLNSNKSKLLAKKNHRIEMTVVNKESVNTSFTLRLEDFDIVSGINVCYVVRL